jgi:hypothetical protein
MGWIRDGIKLTGVEYIVTGIGPAKRVQDTGRSPTTGSYSYTDIDSTKVLRCSDHGFYER